MSGLVHGVLRMPRNLIDRISLPSAIFGAIYWKDTQGHKPLTLGGQPYQPALIFHTFHNTSPDILMSSFTLQPPPPFPSTQFESLFPRCSAVAPVKYAVLSEVDQGYVTSGRAEVTFRLTLSRSDYDFVLYTRDWPPLTDGWSPAHLERAVAVARSKTVTFADAGQPCKARVSLAGPRISNGDAEASGEERLMHA